MIRASQRQRGVIAVLDIGTAKTVCLIAERSAGRVSNDQRNPETQPRVIGLGYQPSRGIKAGVVIDLAEAEACVRATIAQAERMAGVTLAEVLVSVSCGRLKSHALNASIDVAGAKVGPRDVARLMSGARSYVERDGRRLMHLNRTNVHIDGVASDGELIGMTARKLTAAIHAVSADEAPLRNLMIVLERCHIGATGIVVAPYASALAVTTEEERQFGITVIDIGAGTTKLARFSGGNLDYLRCVPVGSALITADIARALHTPLIEAERIKALYGNLISARSDEHETFSYPQADADEGLMQRAPRAQLTSVIRPRAAEILRMVARHRDGRGLHGAPDEPVVLTGGGSLLTGMAEFASEVLQRPVRRVQAAEVSGLPPIARTPAFSTATGLLQATGSAPEPMSAMAGAGESGDEGYIRRVGSWLKSGF